MRFHARCVIVFCLILLVFSLEAQARESKFFGKVSRSSKTISKNENPNTVPVLAQAPEMSQKDVVENGYGLYGREPFQYAPTTKTTTTATATEMATVDDKYVPADELSKTNYKVSQSEKQGMSDTRFLENGKYFYDIKNENRYVNNKFDNHNDNNEYNKVYFHNNDENNNRYTNSHDENKEEVEKQGMSDTRYLENGKYYYHVQNPNEYLNNNHNGYKSNDYLNRESTTYNNIDNANGENHKHEIQRQGMSDTRFLENGKYYYHVENPKGHLNNNQNKYDNNVYHSNFVSTTTNNDNKYSGLYNENHDHEIERQGMSDTIFLENGKYYYDIENEKKSNGDRYWYPNESEERYNDGQNGYVP